MFCPECGKEIENGKVHCRNCGAPVVAIMGRKDLSELYRWLVLTMSVISLLATVLPAVVPNEVALAATSNPLYSVTYVTRTLWDMIFSVLPSGEQLFLLVPAVIYAGSALTLFIIMLVSGRKNAVASMVLSSAMLVASFFILGVYCYGTMTNNIWDNYIIATGAPAMTLCALGCFVFSNLLKKAGKKH